MDTQHQKVSKLVVVLLTVHILVHTGSLVAEFLDCGETRQ